MHSSRAQVIAFGIVSTRDGGDIAVAAGAGLTGPAYDPGMNGRIALVTGAGSGLGAAITHRLAADGAHLVVNDLNADAAAKVAADGGGEAVPFDVTDSRAFTAAVDGVVERHGRIDVLVNNAGIVHDRPEVRARSMANMAARMEGRGHRTRERDVDADGRAMGPDDQDPPVRHLLRHPGGTPSHGAGSFRSDREHRLDLRHRRFGRHSGLLRRQGRDRPVHEVGGSRSSPPLGIRVNVVAPGFIDTPLLAPMADMRGMLEMQIPSGRLGEADEVANLVRFLAGDEASYCFGDVLTLTGGYSI